MSTYTLDYSISHLPKSLSVPNPPGFFAGIQFKEVTSRSNQPKVDAITLHSEKATALKMRRAWDLALAPAKALPMQAIMLYFSGSGIQIFSIGMIFNLLLGPITSVFSILRAFEPFRPSMANRGTGKEVFTVASYSPLTLPMLAYIACQGLVLALGIYKCASMGILPTSSADWLQFESRDTVVDWSAARAAYLG